MLFTLLGIFLQKKKKKKKFRTNNNLPLKICYKNIVSVTLLIAYYLLEVMLSNFTLSRT